VQDAQSPLDADLPPPGGAQLDELRQVVAQARGGDESVRPRLRELLTAYPELWQHFGDLAAQAREAWITLAAGTDLYLQESLRRRMAELQQELAGTSSGPLVRLMVERVMVTWVQAAYSDGLEAQGIAKGEPLRTLTYRARRQAQANRQHLMAIAALATIRKLLPEDAPVGGGPPALSAEIPVLAITAVSPVGFSPPPAARPGSATPAARARTTEGWQGQEAATPAINDTATAGKGLTDRSQGNTHDGTAGVSPAPSGRAAARKKVHDAAPGSAVQAEPTAPVSGHNQLQDGTKQRGPRPITADRLSDLAASAFAFRARLIASGAIPPAPPPPAPPAAPAPRGRRRRKAKAPALAELG
jgi:hypothetical protein